MDAERLRHRGNTVEARRAVEALLKAVPTYSSAWSLLGTIHYSAGDNWSALNAFQRSAMFHSRNHVTHLHIARCLQNLGALDMAEAALGMAVALKPSAPEVLAGRGRLLAARLAYDEAIDVLAKAREADRGNVEIIHTLGETLAYAGRTGEAVECFLEAYRVEKGRNPASQTLPSLLYSIAQSPIGGQRLNLLKEAAALEKAFPAGAPGDSPARLGFVRAFALDREGRFEEAWSALTGANNWIWRHGASGEAAAAAARNHATLQAARRLAAVAERPFDKGEPIALFLTGPSRSGKSVLEGLLVQSLAGTKATFESGIVEPTVAATAQDNELPAAPHVMLLPNSLEREFARNLRQEVRRVAKGNRVVIDTHPGNINHAGWVARALPNAFHVFVGRDEDDNVLRCLQRIYSNGNWYSYDLTECRRHLGWHREMANSWVERLPGRSLKVDYDEIVGDPKGVVQRIAAAIAGEIVGQPTVPGDDRGCAAPYLNLMRS